MQCTIIRTTELAAAQDRLADLERQRDEVMKSYSPAALLDKLQSKSLNSCIMCSLIKLCALLFVTECYVH